jgi:hypothetical protein
MCLPPHTSRRKQIQFPKRCSSYSEFWTMANMDKICKTNTNVLFQIKDWTMDNIQNCDSYINIPSSQTYR